LKETRRSKAPVRVLLESPLEEIGRLLMAGEGTSVNGIGELLDAFGMHEVLVDPITGRAVEELKVGLIGEILKSTQLSELRRATRATSRVDLDAARSHAVALRGLARALAPFLERTRGWKAALPWTLAADTSDVALALSVPGVVLVAQCFPQEMDDFMSQVAGWTQLYSAFNKLLDYLPPECDPMGMGHGGLSEEQSQGLRDAFTRMGADHPADRATIEASWT
jgi:hypothetical protein